MQIPPADAAGLSPPRGVLIDSLSEGGSLMNAGLRQGDVVLAVDGRPIGDPLELRFHVSTKPIGSTAEFDFWRAGKILQTKVRLEAPPEDPPRNITIIQEGSPIDGAEVANLSPAVKEEFNLSVQGGGVVVLRVLNRGFARRLGLRQGDVIMAVNGRDITRVKDLIISAKGRPRAWEITILRGGRRISLQVG